MKSFHFKNHFMMVSGIDRDQYTSSMVFDSLQQRSLLFSLCISKVNWYNIVYI
jgi:hypothetical protein